MVRRENRNCDPPRVIRQRHRRTRRPVFSEVWLVALFIPSGLALLLVTASPAQAGVTRYVNNVDATCHGSSPCYTTIDLAVKAAQPADTIVIQPGTYPERISIRGKNGFSRASETDRISIEADPGAAAGSVVLTGASQGCNEVIRVQKSRFITVRGLTFTGTGAPAISLLGGSNQNQAIHIERNRIVGTGSSTCDSGITVADGNPDTLIANNLIHANGRNGIAFTGTGGGPHYVVDNTIHANGGTGVDVAAGPEVLLVNNLITGNGAAPGSTGGGFGVRRGSATPAHPETIHLLNNLICGNGLGEISGPALDLSDAGNLTPTGAEGPGVSASPGCQLAATVYANVNGPDGVALTADDDFTLAPVSPATDRGLDPRTLGLNPLFTPLFEADFSREAARPSVATATGSLAFDVGALELADTQPPEVTILQPLGGASVRGRITLQAQATDAASGVASIAFSVDRQAPAPLNNPNPAQPFTASTPFDTTSVPDGTHTLRATGVDRAGNSASTTQSFIVDNTPPDTLISAGPSGEITATEATFSVTGSDNLTPAGNLLFAWRLDGGAFTAFTATPTATFTGLGEGSHTFEVKARDRAGNEDPTPERRSFSVNVNALRLTITDPAAGAVVAAGSLLVQGTVQAGGAEAGVAVNGVPAAVQGSAFAALVPIDSGTTALTATATTPAGATASQSIAITVAVTSGSPLTLRPNPAAGVAPLTATFSVFGDPAPVSIELDYDGSGTVDFSGPSLDGQLFSYAQPGLYFPRATITDAQGTRLTITTLVQVYDRALLDPSLQAQWAALRDALQRGDVDGAVRVFALTSRDAYRDQLTALAGAGALTQVASDLGPINLVDVLENAVEYDLKAVRNGVQYSFYVLFVVDSDGLWRLWAF